MIELNKKNSYLFAVDKSKRIFDLTNTLNNTLKRMKGTDFIEYLNIITTLILYFKYSIKSNFKN